MRNELTIESLRKDFDGWREVRVGAERMPQGLLRAAAVLSERTSVALVAKGLNINHTKLSSAVALLRNERLSLLPTSPNAPEREGVPAGKALTFTKVEPQDDAAPLEASEQARPVGLKIHAKLFLPGGASCDVTSLGAFRVLCETLLKGTC